MLEYSVMSPSGKMNVFFTEYETALKIYHENKDRWSDDLKNSLQPISWADPKGKIKSPVKQIGKDQIPWPYIDIETFLTQCEPQEMWKFGYKGSGWVISDREDADFERLNSIEENIDGFYAEPIQMSEFELSLLPEFEGW